MAQNQIVRIEMPIAVQDIRLPKAVNDRLQNLLDRQDRGDKLTANEKKEADGLVELAEMLSLMRMRSERVKISAK
jgi:hypothetical protein